MSSDLPGANVEGGWRSKESSSHNRAKVQEEAPGRRKERPDQTLPPGRVHMPCSPHPAADNPLEPVPSYLSHPEASLAAASGPSAFCRGYWGRQMPCSCCGTHRWARCSEAGQHSGGPSGWAPGCLESLAVRCLWTQAEDRRPLPWSDYPCQCCRHRTPPPGCCALWTGPEVVRAIPTTSPSHAKNRMFSSTAVRPGPCFNQLYKTSPCPLHVSKQGSSEHQAINEEQRASMYKHFRLISYSKHEVIHSDHKEENSHLHEVPCSVRSLQDNEKFNLRIALGKRYFGPCLLFYLQKLRLRLITAVLLIHPILELKESQTRASCLYTKCQILRA